MTRLCRILTILGLVSLATMSTALADPTMRFVKRLELPAEWDRFGYPGCVFADLRADEVFVCDTNRRRIAIYDEHAVFRYSLTAGSTFTTPIDVATDPDGYLFLLTRRGNEAIIAHLDFDGRPIGQLELPSPITDRPADPLSLAIPPDGSRLYVVDMATQSLWILDRDGTVVTSIDLAQGLSEEDAERQLLGQVDVYGETVLVALPSAGYIRLFDLDGELQGRVGIKGTAPCQCGLPVAAALDREGRVWIADRQRMLLTYWDPAENRCLGEVSGLGEAPGRLYNPIDLTLDRRGRVIVSQGFEGRVQIFEGAAPAAGTPR